jgi:hypothetical protein
VPKCAVPVGDGLEAYGCHVALERYGRIEDAVGEAIVAVGQRQELFADRTASGKGKVPHASDFVGAAPLLDPAHRNGGMPAAMPIEVAQKLPHLVNRRVDDRAPGDLHRM